MLPFLLLMRNAKDTIALENDIIVRIAQKDEKALEYLYDKYSKFLYNCILIIVRNQEEAVDLLQELFLHIWKKASTFDAVKGNCYSWLVTLARNLTIDRIRSKRFKGQKQELHNFDFNILYDGFGQNQLDELILTEKAQMVQSALLKIPREEKEVIMLAYYEGYTQTEISEKLNIPLGTVKTRSRNGIQRLQKLIPDAVEK